jgi:hypothetical protein
MGYRHAVQPLPEVERALAALESLLPERQNLVGQLYTVCRVAQALIPSCVGASITLYIGGDPFTMTATTEDARVLDAAQYLEDGPCLTAAQQHQEVSVADVLDEDRWQLFQQASAAVGVRSSLSLTLRDVKGRVAGALNLYAGEPEAFNGRERLIAEAFGARADEMIRNADLAFQTREWARELPARVRRKHDIEVAVGILMEYRGWDAAQARTRLAVAADKAGLSVEKLAEIVLSLSQP